MRAPDDGSTATLRRPREQRIHRCRLTVLAGPDTGKHFDFEGAARIGSRALAGVVLADPSISGLHCEISAGEELRVRDLESKNGTFIGNVRVVEAVLSPGDVLTLGQSRVQVMPIGATVEVLPGEARELHGLVGRSAAMQALITRLESLAATDTTILLQGETGTGKERVAEALHLASKRAQGPLVTVDCGAMPQTLIDAELFGYERGAFTGADHTFRGAFERAHGGTLFLDEVGELPLELQPKLLRVLESREVRRVGGTKVIPIDVRIVAATNRDLPIEVNAGRFREDLYYRLAVVTLTVPPLRDRIEDLPLLVSRLLEEIGGDPAPFLTVEVLQTLAAHPWPGNVRELRNALDRAASLAEPVQLEQPPIPPQSQVALDFDVPLTIGKQRLVAAYERSYLLRLLDQCGGNIAEVARRSGLERMSVYRIMRRLGLRDHKAE